MSPIESNEIEALRADRDAHQQRAEALEAALREAENLCDELRWDGSIQECDKRRIIRVWENLRVLAGREPAGGPPCEL